MTRVTLTLSFLLVLLSIQVAWAGPRVYCRNKPVPGPVHARGSEVYVPGATIRTLFSREASTGDECVRLDGQDAPLLKGITVDGHSLYPLLGIARHLGYSIQVQAALGLIDIYSPTKQRVTNARAADYPVDPVEKELADRGYRQVLKEYGPLCKDPKLRHRVETIGARVAAASDRRGIQWTFVTLESREVNAMSIGMGQVFITRGLLEILDDNQLACALAHEVAHGSKRHSTRKTDWLEVARMYQRQASDLNHRIALLQNGWVSEGTVMAIRATQRQQQEYLAKSAEAMTHVRDEKREDAWDWELESDRWGMIYAHDAGYNAYGMVECLEKMRRLAQGKARIQASITGVPTHPPIEQRISLARRAYSTTFTTAGKILRP